MAKRKTLDYDMAGLTQQLKQSTGQGVDAFFAPAEMPGQDNAQLSPPLPNQQPVETPPSAVPETERQVANGFQSDRSNEATFQPSNERRNERSHVRTKMRHTFDIFRDQLTSLKRIQLEREETFKQTYRLGDLVQEALDLFITHERNKE